jgi:hypothetical protein
MSQTILLGKPFQLILMFVGMARSWYFTRVGSGRTLQTLDQVGKSCKGQNCAVSLLLLGEGYYKKYLENTNEISHN